MEIPLELPPPRGEVMVLATTEEAPLKMGGGADKNFKGEALAARVTFQDKSTEKFLLKFDLSKITRDEIPRATLHLRGAHAENLRIKAVADDSWSSENVTYTSAPKDGEELAFRVSPVNPIWVDVDITEFVRKQMEGDKVVSLLVEAKEKGWGARFASGRLIIEPETITTYPTAPTGLKAIVTDEGIRLEWDASVEGDVKSYNLYREPRVDKEVPMFGGLVDNTFTDKLGKNGTAYTYFVTATDTGTRESAPSAEIIIIP